MVSMEAGDQLALFYWSNSSAETNIVEKPRDEAHPALGYLIFSPLPNVLSPSILACFKMLCLDPWENFSRKKIVSQVMENKSLQYEAEPEHSLPEGADLTQ